MIEKIYELSKIFCKNEETHEKLSEFSNREVGYFVVINLNNGIYEGLSSFKPTNLGKKLLFVGALGNLTTNPSPSINLQGSKNEKDDRKKLHDVLKKFMNFFKHEDTRKIHKILIENYERIYEDLLKIPAKDRSRALLSILIKENSEEFLPSEKDDIKKVFLERQLTHKGESHNTCFFCGRKISSYPQLNEVFKFATFDKPGFTPVISKKAYGVLSICDECRADLKAARTFIENNLSYDFFGGDILWIIPSSPNPNYLKKIIDKLRDIYSKEQMRRFSKTERIIEKRLSEGESVSYDFAVLSISKNEEKILMHATDVSPARLSKIIREADRVMGEFGENYNPTLRNLYEIFKPPKSRGAGKKQFYELVKSMYEDKEFSKETFLFYSMRWARNNISSSDSNTLVPRMIRTGRMLFSFYVYLARINVFKGGKYMENGGFFERYSEFFDKEWKKAVFLTGVLAGYLIGYQSEERGSVPFVKKLKGLKMRKEDVEGLLPEIKAKTLQYKIEDEKLEKIFSSVSQYFLKAGSWQASVDEINFVFTIGMSMYTKFFRRDEDEKE